MWGTVQHRFGESLLAARMHDAEGVAVLRPHQHKGVLSGRDVLQCLRCLLGVVYRLAVNRDDDVSALNAGIVSRASGLNAADHGPRDIPRSLDLLPHVRRQVGKTETPARLSALGTG